MTNEENVIRSVFSSYINDLKVYSTRPNNPMIKMLEDVRDKAIKALEQTDKIEDSNFSTKQYKADIQVAYDCGYNSGYAQAMMDIAESEGAE